MRVQLLPATALATTFAITAFTAPQVTDPKIVPVAWADIEAGAYAAQSSAAAANHHKRDVHDHIARVPQVEATDKYGDPRTWGQLAEEADQKYCPSHPDDPACKKRSAKRAAGDCEGASSNCVGAVTHWDGGLGSCGDNVDTNVDYAVSLPHAFMEAVEGANPNLNPYCGRTVTIVNPSSGKTASATVKDKCGGCEGYHIDLTDVLFADIAGCDGTCDGFQWYLNGGTQVEAQNEVVKGEVETSVASSARTKPHAVSSRLS